MKITCISLFVCLSFIQTFAQKKSVQLPYTIGGKIVGKGKAYPDKISLRWNISNYQLFDQMVKDGVFIDRLILGKDNKAESKDWVRISKDTIKAATLQEMTHPGFEKDTALIIMAQTLYGKSEYPKGLSLIAQVKMQDEERQNRHLIASLYSAISPSAAKYAGLAFDDTLKVDFNKKYVYRISAAKPYHYANSIDTGFVYVIGHDAGVKEKFFGLQTKNGEQTITLKWLKENSPFTGYYIQRSIDKINFKNLNTQIYLPATDTTDKNVSYYYVDSVANYKPYYYRLIGVNAFGEHQKFEETAQGMAVDRTPPSVSDLKFDKKGNEVVFTWNKSLDKDLKGYYLLGGSGLNQEDSIINKTIMPPSQISQKVVLSKDFKSAYYRLMAVDTAGNASFSSPAYVFIPDTIPPLPPSGLKGLIDTTGLVVLKWKPDISGKALRGYKVYAANQENHEFIPISDMMGDTTYSFKTTLNTLTKKLFIKITAIDGNFNGSKMSQALILERPDILPPSVPVIQKYSNNANGVKIYWTGGIEEDFSHFNLYRKASTDSLYQIIGTTKDTSFEDTTALGGLAYLYTITAVDSSHLASALSFPLYLKTQYKETAYKPNLRSNYDEAKKEESLTWEKPHQEVDFFIVYKDDGDGLSMYKSISGNQNAMVEANVKKQAKAFGIKVVYKDKTESEVILGQ
ncbi:hypothetical protein I5M32_02090 [Pedobacter sp. SD-b]|uniref:Fibronectin type 3 domain-containing protein n=1 Tax=Pedobacter segetis TaxID=2793069 RepID=A0ABS1BFV3_9SPHI|nr:hypothetical protein [Pedobacter segetis]MBK0381738.1 hypothetical protein [Pedobacter segetis]